MKEKFHLVSSGNVHWALVRHEKSAPINEWAAPSSNWAPSQHGLIGLVASLSLSLSLSADVTWQLLTLPVSRRASEWKSRRTTRRRRRRRRPARGRVQPGASTSFSSSSTPPRCALFHALCCPFPNPATGLPDGARPQLLPP